jgi:glycopeptide antibiotics resistance protein
VLKLIGLVPLLLFAVLWVVLLVILRVRREAGWVHLLLVAIFGAYLYAVLDVTLLQFQSLLLLKLFQPDLILRGIEAAQSLNFVPLVGLSIGDLPTSLLNILMLVPFGFGLPFLTGFRFAQVVASGALFSLAIEALQLATGQWAGTTFRVTDINDVIFNTTGAAIGYLLFIGFLRLLRAARGGSPVSNPLLRHLIERPQI